MWVPMHNTAISQSDFNLALIFIAIAGVIFIAAIVIGD